MGLGFAASHRLHGSTSWLLLPNSKYVGYATSLPKAYRNFEDPSEETLGVPVGCCNGLNKCQGCRAKFLLKLQ